MSMTRIAAMAAAVLMVVPNAAHGQTGQRATAKPAAATAATNEARTARYMESIRNDPSQLIMFLRDMPKGGDLHNHMSGAIYAESYLKWAAEDGLCINVHSSALSPAPCDRSRGNAPADTAYSSPAMYSQVIDAWSMRNWDAARKNGHDQFFDTFGKFFMAAGSRRTADMLAEASNRAAADRVSYLELLWTPDDISFGGLAGARDIDANFSGLRDRLLAAGLRDRVGVLSRQMDSTLAKHRMLMRCNTAQPDPGCKVEVRLLYQVLRAFPQEMVFAQILAGFEMASKDRHIVGINLVQPEDDPVAMRDFSLHMRIIGWMRNIYPTVQVTLHAGELVPGLVPPEGLRFHISESVRVARASRIGHGIDIAYEDSAQALLQEMARKGIVVEIALTSNAGILGVSGKEHPLRLYMKYGVPVVLATDDEGVSRGDMTTEYRRAVQEQGLTYQELKKMASRSIDASFADFETVARLAHELAMAFVAFEAKYATAR